MQKTIFEQWDDNRKLVYTGWPQLTTKQSVGSGVFLYCNDSYVWLMDESSS